MTHSRFRRFLPRLEPLEGRLLPTTYMVTNTNNSGAGSLRRAIQDANGNAGADSILFNIAGAGVHTITPSSALPKITGPVILDATSEPGYAGTPLIELNGSGVGFDQAALWITGNGSTIKGLAVNRTTTTWGIRIDGSNNTIRANFIGIDPTGTIARPNSIGVLIYSGTGNVIGGPTAADRNVISGNDFEGIKISDADGNTVEGNYIGTTASGATPLGNTGVGIVIGTSLFDGYHNGTSSAENVIRKNVISGNAAGVQMLNPDSIDNLIVGNFIGINAAGSAAIGNTFMGIGIFNAPNNQVGGTNVADRNVIAGNATGIAITTEVNAFWVTGTASANAILNNYIGTDSTGTVALGNVDGIIVQDSPDTVIGGTTASARNLISGNTQNGLWIALAGSTGTIAQGNYIGTTASGAAALANGRDGVYIEGGATLNTIGGTANGAGNVISANGRGGIHIAGVGTSFNSVEGNRVGTNAAGTAKLGNTIGVLIDQGASSNTVGGETAAARNLLSGNKRAGIGIGGTNSDDNVVQGNYIGTDVTGLNPLGNSTGLNVFRRASNNIVGGTSPAARNVIAGNGGTGIAIRDQFTDGNTIIGNYIGVGANGVNAMGNFQGITITGLAGNTIVGGTVAGAGNVIAHSSLEAVLVEAGVGNAIRANSMFNNNPGIVLLNAANNDQPAPVITSATTGGGIVSINGSLTATADTIYSLDFFASDACHWSGFGEGQNYIGSADIVTDSNGDATFTEMFSASVPSGNFITATATSPENDTSVFSACFALPAPLPPGPGRSHTSLATALESFDRFGLMSLTGKATKPVNVVVSATGGSTAQANQENPTSSSHFDVIHRPVPGPGIAALICLHSESPAGILSPIPATNPEMY